MRAFGLFLLIIGNNAYSSNSWLCTEEASQRRGNSIYSCGIGEAGDEAEARLRALDSAKTEFSRLCEASDDCRGHKIDVEPGRTTCESGERYKCYRLVIFKIGGRGIASVVSRFVREKSARVFAKIKVGMRKTEVLKRFGAPQEAGPDVFSPLTFTYNDSMCVQVRGVSVPGFCFVSFDTHGRVTSYTGVSPVYTEMLQ